MDKIGPKISVLQIYISVFGVMLWNSPKKSKSPMVSPLPKAIGTLIFLVNSAALHQKHLCILLTFLAVFINIPYLRIQSFLV